MQAALRNDFGTAFFVVVSFHMLGKLVLLIFDLYGMEVQIPLRSFSLVILVGLLFRKSQFVTAIRMRSLFNFGVFLALILITTYTVINNPILQNQTWKIIALHVSNTFLTGVVEELLFRFVLFTAIFQVFSSMHRKPWRIVLWTSFVFAVLHATNIIYPGYHWSSALNQVILAFGTGMLFQVIYLTLRSIWLVAGLHYLANFFGTLRRLDPNAEALTATSERMLTGFAIISVLSLLLIFIAYSLFREKYCQRFVTALNSN